MVGDTAPSRSVEPEIALVHAREYYRRTMARWAADLLSGQPEIAWPQPDALADFRNHDWRLLYTGSVLDD